MSCNYPYRICLATIPTEYVLRLSLQNMSCDYPLQEWADYDEKAKESVGIYEIEHNFVKVHN